MNLFRRVLLILCFGLVATLGWWSMDQAVATPTEARADDAVGDIESFPVDDEGSDDESDEEEDDDEKDDDK
jgi:hypothetical protein